MASVEATECVHKHIGIYSGVGSLMVILGFLCHNLEKDIHSVGLNGKNFFIDVRNEEKRQKIRRLLIFFSYCFIVLGFLFILVSLAYFSHEREELGSTVASQVLQLVNKEAAPNHHEPLIIAVIAVLFIFIGTFGMYSILRTRDKKKGFLFFSCLVIGYILLMFPLSTTGKSLKNIQNKKLVWLLPSSFLISVGFLLEFYVRYQQMINTGIPQLLYVLGFICLTVGNSMVVSAPTVDEIE